MTYAAMLPGALPSGRGPVAAPSGPAIAAWLGAGLDRVIVGTRALQDPPWFRSMIEKYPGRLTLGLDAKDGRVATGGWLEVSSVDAAELAGLFDDLPMAAVIYTDIAR